MDLKRKGELAKNSIISISRHEDEDAAVREAFLDEMIKFIHEEKNGIVERRRERLRELLSE